MLPSPAEQQQLLLKTLESMPSAEHERFLGEKLHLLVQVHILSIFLSFYLSVFLPFCLSNFLPFYLSMLLYAATHHLKTKQGAPPARVWQAVDPARAGKITGMLLELDVHQIVALIVFPDMVRSTSPCSRLHSPTRPVAPRGAAATEKHQ